MRGSEATSRNPCDVLAERERAWRIHAEKLSALQREIKRVHPEMITADQWTRIRRWYLEGIAADIQLSLDTADSLADLRRQMDVDRSSQGHH